jgi:hypothetical protein
MDCIRCNTFDAHLGMTSQTSDKVMTFRPHHSIHIALTKEKRKGRTMTWVINKALQNYFGIPSEDGSVEGENDRVHDDSRGCKNGQCVCKDDPSLVQPGSVEVNKAWQNPAD